MAQFLQRWNEEFSHFNELSNKSFVHGHPVKQVNISGRLRMIVSAKFI
jgi:hypothetical protein